MSEADIDPRLSPTATGIGVLITITVLWFGRDVMSIDVILRLVLPGLWVVAWSFACFAAGWPVVSAVLGRTDRARAPALVVCAAGAAVLAFLGAVLAVLGIFDSRLLALVLAAATIAGPILGWRNRAAVEWLPPGLASPLMAIVLIPAGVTLIVLSTPPVMYDALHYHLAFPQQWLMHGGFVEFAREPFSYYSSAHGTLFAFALSTIGPWGANAINWWMAAVATLAAATLGDRLAGPRAAAWAAVCFACTPATLEIAGYAIADHAVAGWAGAALVTLVAVGKGPPATGRIALAAALAASAAAAKYLALATVLLPVAVVAIFLMWRPTSGRPRQRAVLGLTFAVAAALPLAPWLGRNLGWTGNPVYPYLTEAFGGPPTDLTLATEIGRNTDLPETAVARVAATVGALARRTFTPRIEGGLLGPHWLILLPLALVVGGLRRSLRGAMWTATVVGLLAWGSLVQYARFLLPVLVPAAALAGAAAAALTVSTGRASRTAITTVLVVLFAWNSSIVASKLNLDRLAVVTGRLSDADYRARWFDAAPVTDFVALALPADARILLIGEVRSFGLERTILVEDPYRTPLMVELASTSPSPESLARELRTLGVTHILVNENEMPRFARIRRVPDYFSGASKDQRAVIAAFLDHQVERLFAHDGVWVARIIDGREPPQTRDTDQPGTASTDSPAASQRLQRQRTTPGSDQNRGS